jgi:pimeloyl-ACP methyl ester carboxylesterase
MTATTAHWTHGHADVGGLRMHFVEQGSGPAVLLLHGFPESWYSWRHQLPALARAGFRAIAPDQRGYGQTDAPESIEAYSQLRLVGDVVGLLDALEIERAVVVGHDWGAPVAWNAALLRPDRFRAVVGVSVPWLEQLPGRPTERLAALSRDVFNYVLYFQAVGPAEAELAADVRASLRRLFYALSGDLPTERRPWGRLPRHARLMDQMPEPPRPLAWLSEKDLDFFAGEFERRGFGPGLNWYRNLDRSAEELRAFRGLSPEVPAGYIQGEFDFPGADAAALERMAAKLAGWRGSEVIAGAGHWVQQEKSAAFNAALLRFLATSEGPWTS